MENNFFTLLTAIYKKDKVWTTDVGLCIALTKTLSKEPSNMPALKQAIPYLFYIEPKHYFFLLFFLINKKSFVPKSIKTEKVEEKDNALLEEIKQYLEWSNREFTFNREILESQVLKDEKQWKEEFAIK